MKRRNFIKQIGLAASLPLLPMTNFAAEDSSVKIKTPTHKILSCNIRVALPEDETTGNGWKARRDLCIEVIRAQRPDIFCLQEVLREQMRDVEKGFPKFGSFGFEGPEMDARMVGYGGIAKNPIFYSLDRYEIVTEGGFWLSETPHLPGSISWDSARARHVNWVRLRDRQTQKQFRVLSTHLDHINQHAREEQMKMILANAAIYAPEFPQIFAGDFNARTDNKVHELVLDAGWTDTHLAAPEPHDNGYTVHGFLGDKHLTKKNEPDTHGPIDFIFTHGPIKTVSWKIIRDSRDGHYPSDHYFIAAELAFT